MTEDFGICSEDILYGKWKSWCRLCAKADAEYINIVAGQSQGVSMNDDSFTCEKDLANIIRELLKIHIEDDDKLPQIICETCHEFVLKLIEFSEHANKVQEMYYELQNSIDKSAAQLQRLLENYGINAYKDEVMIPQSDMELLTDDIFVADLEDTTTIAERADANNDEMSTIEQRTEEMKEGGETPMGYPDPIAAVEKDVESESGSPAHDIVLSSASESCTEDESLPKPQVIGKSRKFAKTKNADEKRCKICVTNFCRRANLTVHMKNKHNLLLCRRCTSTFKTESELKQHIKAEHHKLWNCLHCAQTFTRKGLVSRHIKMAHNAKKKRKRVNKQTPVEEKVFTDLEDTTNIDTRADRDANNDDISTIEQRTEYIEQLQITIIDKSMEYHDSMVVAEKDVERKYCAAAPGDGFSSASEGSCEDESLSKAKDAITNTTNEFCCSICSKEFHRHCNLTVHLKKYHDLLLCRRCTSTFKTADERKEHMNTQHRKTWNCLRCGQIFERKGLLSHHMKIEHDPKPKKGRSMVDTFDVKPATSSFVCEVCGDDLRSKKKLKLHYHTHAENTFECKECGKILKTLDGYRRHLQIHGDNFICQTCGQVLSTKATYNRHMLVHSDVLKHKCDVCGRAFKRGRALKYHLIAHTGLRPYSCDFCGKTFTTGSSCRLHKKTMHPNELVELEASGMKTFTQNVPKLDLLKKVARTGTNFRPLMSKQDGYAPRV